MCQIALHLSSELGGDEMVLCWPGSHWSLWLEQHVKVLVVKVSVADYTALTSQLEKLQVQPKSRAGFLLHSTGVPGTPRDSLFERNLDLDCSDMRWWFVVWCGVFW